MNKNAQILPQDAVFFDVLLTRFEYSEDMHKPEPTQSYCAYLLRIWQIQNAQDVIWHASLESPDGSEKLGFASLQALYDFLNNKTQALNVSHPSSQIISSHRRTP